MHEQNRAKPVEIVCHRGANHLAPENTFAAAQACLDLGVDYIEVDVWTSRDGIFYVMHDPTVDRTTNGSGYLLALNSTEIDQLDAGSWFDPRFAGERVPRLDLFLKWVKGKAKVFFDVKFAHPQQLIDLIYQSGLAEECFIWSYSSEWMYLCHQMAPDLPLKINVSSAADVVVAHERYGATIVEVDPENLTASLIDACRRRSMRVMANTRENTTALFRELLHWEIDMINLDRPDLFLRIVNGTDPDSSQ
jgi:glycerophosphoryl diester phosphodiesterase